MVGTTTTSLDIVNYFSATILKDDFDYTFSNVPTRLVLNIAKASFAKGKTTLSSYLEPFTSKLRSESFNRFYQSSS